MRLRMSARVRLVVDFGLPRSNPYLAGRPGYIFLLINVWKEGLTIFAIRARFCIVNPGCWSLVGLGNGCGRDCEWHVRAGALQNCDTSPYSMRDIRGITS
jgi:hypothetical protein